MKRLILLLFPALAIAAVAQQAQDVATANPARPTVSTPATLTPAGYFQFESGFLAAWHSEDLTSQESVNELVKFAPWRRVEFQIALQPFGHSRVANQNSNATGDIIFGVQGVLHDGEGAKPTIALSYLRRVYAGNVADLDIGSFRNSASVLISADVKGFHYDNNYVFNEQVDSATHRAQFGQTLSISHPLTGKFGLTGEIWHFTQPFLYGHAIGNLWAVNYNARSNLVFDAGFNRGLTSTSTRWEVFTGFTYLLPHKVRLL
jgi:hypothetical protein